MYLNSILVKAYSAETAYTRALEICAQSNQEYLNPDGKLVACRFRGLADLFPIHDDLEDGAELSFTSLGTVSAEEISTIVRAKGDLDLFHTNMQEAQQ